jgi:ABC-type Fe3+/spermidine/putrescine transport system ATPase subunit
MVNGLSGRAGPEPTGEVALEGVSKRFGPVEAVRDLTLEIHAGEFFSLLGPSGCGKSTTLRLIAGFEEPTTGRIVRGGKDVTRTPPHIPFATRRRAAT